MKIKELAAKSWAKITAYLLFCILAPLTILFAAGAYYAYSQGWDVNAQTFIQSNICTHEVSSDMQQVYWGLETYGLDENLAEKINTRTPFSFVVKDEAGAILLDARHQGAALCTKDGYWISLPASMLQLEENSPEDSSIDTEEETSALQPTVPEDAVEPLESAAMPEDVAATDTEYAAEEPVLQENAALETAAAEEEYRTLSIEGYLDNPWQASEEYQRASLLFAFLYSLSGAYLPLSILSALLSLLLFFFLLAGAGHRAGREGVTLGWLARLPFDLYLGLTALLLYLPFAIMEGYGYSQYVLILETGALLIWFAIFLLALCLNFSARVKAGKWWKNTIIWQACRWFCQLLGRFFRALPLTWKSTLIYCGFLFFFFLLITVGAASASLFAFFCALLLAAAGGIALTLYVRQLYLLAKAGQTLAAGDLDHRIDSVGMKGEVKTHAEALNSISNAMNRAVAERLKSEHMKTELITNVSHDIKTPLTSILNYLDLLKKAEPGSEAAAACIEVLERQAQRLKKLTEDVVEASKAATGNLPVSLLRTDVSELLAQAAGEFEEKLAEAGLTLVVDPPLHDVAVMADSRLLSRVFDNLFSNVAKYAQPQTRVFLRAAEKAGQVEILLLNTSRNALNISPEALMERFVRGDEARSSEGSGLGLSIAQSLMQLQGGVFRMEIEGDLFKAICTFPALS